MSYTPSYKNKVSVSNKGLYTQSGRYNRDPEGPIRIKRRSPIGDLVSYLVFISLIIGVCFLTGFMGFILTSLGF